MTLGNAAVLVELGGIQIYWYSVMFGLGVTLGYLYLRRIYVLEGKATHDVEYLMIKICVCIYIGARLFHSFYYPGYYLANPQYVFFSYEYGGLSSHGGVLGLVVGLAWHSKRHPDQSLLWTLDRIAPAAALTGGLLRIGNFFNSQIVGKPTDLPWGVVFTEVDDVARHPSQLYEAIAYLLLALLGHLIYRKYGRQCPPGLLFGALCTLAFSVRFLLEYVKANVASFEFGLFNVGQLFSLPFIAVGVWLVFRSLRNKNLHDRASSHTNQ